RFPVAPPAREDFRSSLARRQIRLSLCQNVSLPNPVVYAQLGPRQALGQHVSTNSLVVYPPRHLSLVTRHFLSAFQRCLLDWNQGAAAAQRPIRHRNFLAADDVIRKLSLSLFHLCISPKLPRNSKPG